ncbi:hypothetical protein K438DRAFT_2015855 [Mycena galopus ATCC 62051]|nr:hypothetical protein K438DRAFT_2015855 [Mycena galopus ATCC 62051]
MCLLPPRYACNECSSSNARCAVFVVSDLDPRTQTPVPRFTPRTTAEACVACGHAWASHNGVPCQDPTHPNFPFRRGGFEGSKCGGFYSNDLRWSFLTVCICLALWTSHQTVDPPVIPGAPVAPSVPVPASVPPTLSLSVAAPVSAFHGVATAAPITAFQGVPPAIGGSANTRRMASALRTLPQHQATSNTRGSRRAYPSASPFSQNVSILVAIFPLTIPGDHEPAGYGTRVLKARNNDMLDVLNRFGSHHLLVQVDVPRHGLASPPDFTQQITTALALHGMALPPPSETLPDGGSAQLTRQPLALLSPTRRLDIVTFKPHPTINANNFGAEEFTRLARKFTNPDPSAGPNSILIFVAPRFGHLLGPINHPHFVSQDLPGDGLNLPHSCFGIRMLDRLPLQGSSIYPDPECLEGICPAPETVRIVTPPPSSSVRMAIPPLVAPSSLIRPRSLSDSSPSAGRRVRVCPPALDRLSPTLQAPPPRLLQPPVPTFPPVQRSEQVPPLIPQQEIATAAQVQTFRDRVKHEASRPRVPFVPRLVMHARGIDDGARFVVSLLGQVNARLPPLLPDGIISCSSPINSKASFLKDGHAFKIGVRPSGDEVSFGPGPERAVYRRCIELMTEDTTMWQQSPHSRFVVPVFTPGNVEVPGRIALFEAHGSVLAIHSVILGHGPNPISIWLVLALCMGRDAMLKSQRYLAALDPAAFECLAPWFMFNAHDTIPAHPLHPFNQFLFNVMDIQPAMIQSPRTPEVHDNWTVLFMSKVLLNRTDVFSHPEFLALRRGLDIKMGPTSFISELGGLNGMLRVFAAMYNLRVQNVVNVSSRLSWQILLHAANGTTPYYGAIFRLLVERYVGHVGHPMEFRGTVVDEDEWCKGINDSTLRARLLLQAASDSDLLPSSDSWCLKFRFVGITTVNDPNPRPLHFHTCMYEVDVKISQPLEDLLMRSCVKLDDSNHSTAFDLWFHGSDHETPSDEDPPNEAMQRRTNEWEILVPITDDVFEVGPTRSPTPDIFGGGSGQRGVAPGMTNVRSMLAHLQESLAQDEQDERDRHMDSDEEPGPPAELTILSVDAGEGTFQERADRLIQEILQLQPGFGRPSTQSPGASPTPMELVLSPPRRHAVPLSASIIEPRGAGMISVTDMQGNSRSAMYFVGIQTLALARSFCQTRSFTDAHSNDGAVFTRLQLAGGPVGRALSSISDRQTFFVGASDYPVDIGNDHTNHRYNFREIGSLFEVEQHHGANVHFFPIPDSPARSALIQSQRAPGDIDVYVLYLYHPDADSLALTDASPANADVHDSLAPPQSIVQPLPVLSGSMTASHDNPVLDTVTSYLRTRFAPEYSQLTAWRASSYGSAYSHCLIERQIMRICQLLGIGLLGRNHTPAIVCSMTVRLDDVVAAAGINAQTFSTYRTELRLIKEAHLILRRLHRAGQLPQGHKPLLDCLEVMLSERTLSADATRPLPGSEQSAEAEFSAVRMTISTVMIQVRQVIDTFGNT